MSNNQQEWLQKHYKDAEIQYGLAGLSPRQRATSVIRRIKFLYNSHIRYTGLETQFNYLGMLYLFSENCELTWEQKAFAIHCAFRESFATSSTFVKGPILNSLAHWGIIDALKLYNDDEQAGIKWFKSHNISMQDVHQIIDGWLFRDIVRKYPELKSLRKKHPQDAASMKVSGQQIETLWAQAIELIKKGDYDRSHYDLLKVMGQGPRTDCTAPRDLSKEIQKQIKEITTKEDMIKILDLLYYDFGWLDHTIFTKIHFDDELRKHIRKVLGVRPGEENIENFDLKNARDIARCKEIFPLAISYPEIFIEWYPRRGNGYYLGSRPLFIPEYDNGLEKKRKELHYRLATKGIVGKVLSKTLVPEELGTLGKKLERFVAGKMYANKRPGRN